MGLLQAGYRTYESRRALAGVPVEGEETLTPVSHMVQNVQIEITLGSDGAFQDAKAVPKENGKTIIPVTEESAGRRQRPGPSPHGQAAVSGRLRRNEVCSLSLPAHCLGRFAPQPS